jgi:D-glycero-alpha-D-manno-heptose-7-phosphate kinase
MIVVQTPLRLSFFGGGTDFPSFAETEEGCVLSSAINKYVYVIIKERCDHKIRVGYTRTELVDCIDEVQHDLVRESLRLAGIPRGVEISTMADIPSTGSGLGSSSAVTVGLLNAMYHYLSDPCDRDTLARQACEIELDILQRPMGRQDQYIAAYGGQRLIRFMRSGSVEVQSPAVPCQKWEQLCDRLLLFFTNVTRDANTILHEQARNTNGRNCYLRMIKQLVQNGQDALQAGEFDEFGRLLNQGWALKRQLASKVSNETLDQLYCTALSAGALGGKIAGAGGGGYLLLYCRPQHQDSVRSALSNLPELRFRFESDGSKVILNYRRSN